MGVERLHAAKPWLRRTAQRVLIWPLLAVVCVFLPGQFGWTTFVRPAGVSGSFAWQGGGLSGALYVGNSLVLLGLTVLILIPGWCLMGCIGVRDTARRLVYGGASSIVFVAASVHFVERIFDLTIRGNSFLGLLGGLSLISATLFHHLKKPVLRDTPPETGVWSYVLVSAISFVALAPKISWESLNGDGAHAYETIRWACQRFMPFFGPEAGKVGAFPTDTSFFFAWPGSLYMRFLGEVDAAARAPYVLALVLLVAAIVLVAETTRTLRNYEFWLLTAGLGVVSQTLIFSATYSPYSTDMACPAAQDLWLVFGFTGFIGAFLRRDVTGTAALVLVTYTSVPSGRLLIAMFLCLMFVIDRKGKRRVFISAVIALTCGLMFSKWGNEWLPHFDQAPFGREYENLKSRFRELVLTDWHRWLFLVVPCSMTPLLAMRHIRRDPVTRVLSAVCAGYFLLFYIQKVVALHHFAPAMVLPLVVFWRHGASSRGETLLLITGISISLMLTRPAEWGIFTAAEDVGARISDQRGIYSVAIPDAMSSSEIFEALFLREDHPDVPEKAYGGSALVWQRYADRHDRSTDAPYLWLNNEIEPPQNYQLVKEHAGTCLYVRSPEVLRSDQMRRPPTPVAAAVFQVERRRLFPHKSSPGDPLIVDLRQLLEAFRRGD